MHSWEFNWAEILYDNTTHKARKFVNIILYNM